MDGLGENSLVQISTPEGDVIYRVLRLSFSTNSAQVIDTNLRNKKAKPFRFSVDALLVNTDARQATLLDREIFLELHAYKPEGEVKEKRDRYWKCFEPYLNDPRILNPRKWSAVISELFPKLGLSEKQTRNLLRRWIQTGFAKNALTEFRFAMGRKGRPKNQATRTTRLGPYTKDDITANKETSVQRKTGIPITLEVESQFQAAEIRYRKGLRNVEGARRPTVEQAYQWLLEKYYREKSIKVKKGRLKPLEGAPTKRQFANWLKKNLDPIKAAKDRLGEVETDLNHQPTPGRAADLEPEPGETIAFDSTILDIYVRSSTNPNLPVRRPRLYQGVCFNSNYRLMPYLTLEDESYSTVSQALALMFTSPVEFLKKYNIHVNEEDIPYFVPSRVITDRLSTYLGDQMADAKDNLHFTLGRPKAFLGNKKGPVEGSFDQLIEALISQLPGYVPKNRQRDAKPPQATSLLTFEELYELILLEIIRWNKYEPLKRYPENDGMTADDVVLTPLNILLHRHRNAGALRTEPTDTVYQYLLPHEEAWMTPAGLLFRTLRYTGELIQNRDWMTLTAISGNFPVQVSYYDNSTTYVFLRPDPINQVATFEKCTLINSIDMEKFKGVTFKDVREYRGRRHAKERGQEQDRRQSLANRNQRIDELVAGAKAREKALSEFPSPNRNIAEETAQERDRHRREAGQAWEKRWEDQPLKSNNSSNNTQPSTADPAPQERKRIDFTEIRKKKKEQDNESS